jgi:hypothetical protein
VTQRGRQQSRLLALCHFFASACIAEAPVFQVAASLA